MSENLVSYLFGRDMAVDLGTANTLVAEVAPRGWAVAPWGWAVSSPRDVNPRRRIDEVIALRRSALVLEPFLPLGSGGASAFSEGRHRRQHAEG